MSLLRHEVVDLLNFSINFHLELVDCDITSLFSNGVEEKLMKKYNIKYNFDKDIFD